MQFGCYGDDSGGHDEREIGWRQSLQLVGPSSPEMELDHRTTPGDDQRSTRQRRHSDHENAAGRGPPTPPGVTPSYTIGARVPPEQQAEAEPLLLPLRERPRDADAKLAEAHGPAGIEQRRGEDSAGGDHGSAPSSTAMAGVSTTGCLSRAVTARPSRPLGRNSVVRTNSRPSP